MNSQKVARYVLLPGIIPRIGEAFGSSFAFLAFAFANCFDMVRLLPPNHPYMRQENYGTFSMLDVLRTAGANLKFDLKHIDQVLIYFAILVGFVMFFMMFGLTFAFALMTPASAMPLDAGTLMANIYTYTATPFPQQDIALVLLDKVMGVTNGSGGTFFGSDVASMCSGGQLGAATCTTPDPFPTAYHNAFHALLRFYSFAILCVAAITLVYFVFILVMETTLTGVAMGSRFNRFWMPLRLVFALGLLIPMDPHGLNSAQYIVLYTAKIGSAFATNGWIYYNEYMQANIGTGVANPMGMEKQYVWDPKYSPTISNSSPLAAKLNAPDMGDLSRFLHLVFSCEYYYERISPLATPRNIQGYFVAMDGSAAIPAYTEPTGSATGSHPNYQAALNYFNYGNINIVFGELDAVKYGKLPGGVNPLCGSMVIPVTSVNDPATGAIDNPGAAMANELYYENTMDMMDKSNKIRQLMDGYASQMVEKYAKMDNANPCRLDSDTDGLVNDPLSGTNLVELGPCWNDPDKNYMRWQIETVQTIFQFVIDGANGELADPANWGMTNTILNRGWAGAGIYINTIAKMNGGYVSSVQQIPYGADLPQVMEKTKLMAQLSLPNIQDYKNVLSLLLNQKNALSQRDQPAAIAFDNIYKHLFGDSNRFSFRSDPATGIAGVSGLKGFPILQGNDQKNPVLDAINIVLGTQFLFNFRDNQNTHPLTQLITFGRTLLERSARNLLTGSAVASVGGVMNLGNEDLGSALKKTSAFFFATASIFFMAGFTLFYILPMLPFVYFFFAMLSWVKAVFEAMLGAPLWALAHTRLKGSGFPSSASIGGYLLLMEIFLRPIITVFGLIAAIGVFTAAIYMLNDVFSFVVFNATGSSFLDFGTTAAGTSTMSITDLRSPLDQFFYNILYIILVYMFANSCFQLIDKIPNSFMKWFGGGLKSFSAEAYRRDSPASSFMTQSAIAIANPARGFIAGAGEQVYSASNTAAVLADEAAPAGSKISEMVRNTFGADRNTTINESLTKMEQSYRASVQEAAGLNKAAEKAKNDGDVALANKLKAEAAEKLERAQADDPEMLMKELANPGKSGMSPIARALAEDNLNKMKGIRSMTQDLLNSGGVLRAGSGQAGSAIKQGTAGSFTEQDDVNDAIMALVQRFKQSRKF